MKYFEFQRWDMNENTIEAGHAGWREARWKSRNITKTRYAQAPAASSNLTGAGGWDPNVNGDEGW